MSFRALYDKVKSDMTSFQSEWEDAIKSLDAFEENAVASIRRNAELAKKTQKTEKKSCAYLVNPKRMSIGKSRRKSSQQTNVDDGAKAAETEEPIAKSKRSVRACRKKAVSKGQNLDTSSSSQEQVKPKKKRGKAKKSSTSLLDVIPDTPESKRLPHPAARLSASSDTCLTPRRSVGSLVPMQECRKLLEQTPPQKENKLPETVTGIHKCESVEEKGKEQPAKRTPLQEKNNSLTAKPSSSNRQIFSPYSLDSTKKKAEAYENHIARQGATVKRVTEVSTSRSDVTSPRRSAMQKRRSSLTKPSDKLILAKAARMSVTQRRSSLVRYHLQVAMNQVARKVSLEKRRLSIAESRRTSENALAMITEQETPKRTDLPDDSISKNMPKSKRSKPSDDVLLVDATFILSKTGSDRQSSGCGTSSPRESASNMNPKVRVERLSKEQIAKFSGATLQPPSSASDENLSSDSYISEDEPVSSTPMATHFTKKFPQLTLTSQPSAYKNKYPGSEPRPTNKSRVALLSSMLNISNSRKRHSSTANGSRIISFLKSRPPSQDFAAKKMIKLKEEIQRKKEKEELAFQRREEMLKNKVLSQKKKLNEKMAKVAENRLQKEKEQDSKSRALELLLQQSSEKQRIQAENKRRAIEERRLMRAKKEAEIEERRKQEEAAKLTKMREQEALEKMRLQEQEQLKAAISHHNSSLQKKAILNTLVKEKADATATAKVDLNQTYSCEGSQDSANNYDITPHRSELPPEELKDPENYDIANLKSDDDTDDECDPRKKIPTWAQGAPLKTALLQQSRKMPDLDVLFPQMLNIDLAIVFGNIKQKQIRTSSAVWITTP